MLPNLYPLTSSQVYRLRLVPVPRARGARGGGSGGPDGAGYDVVGFGGIRLAQRSLADAPSSRCGGLGVEGDGGDGEGGGGGDGGSGCSSCCGSGSGCGSGDSGNDVRGDRALTEIVVSGRVEGRILRLVETWTWRDDILYTDLPLGARARVSAASAPAPAVAPSAAKAAASAASESKERDMQVDEAPGGGAAGAATGGGSGGGDSIKLRIAAPPLAVFEAFTSEIGRWWVTNPLFMLTPRGDGILRDPRR